MSDNDSDDIVEWSKNKQRISSPDLDISIYKTDLIAIPTAVYREYFGDDKPAAKLLYDRDNRRIGIQPAADDDPDSYSVGSGTPTLNCQSYLDSFELTVEESTKIPAEWDPDSEIIWADPIRK